MLFFKLKVYDLSEQSFLIGLKHNQVKGSLYSALAVLALIKQNLDEHYKYLCLAFKDELQRIGHIRDPNILLYLSEHYLYKGDFKRTEKIAHLAYQVIESLPFIQNEDQSMDINPSILELKSRIYYVKGFIYHEQKSSESYKNAEHFYKKAIAHFPENFAA